MTTKGFSVVNSSGQLKIATVGQTGPTGPTGPTGASAAATVVYKTSAETSTGAALQDDDELLFSVTATGVYQFDATLFVSCATTGPDISVNWTIPTGATLSTTSLGHDIGATGVAGAKRLFAFHRALTTANFGTIASGTAASTPVLISGLYIGGGTTGSVQLQWCQANADTGNPVTVRADSYIRITQIS